MGVIAKKKLFNNAKKVFDVAGTAALIFTAILGIFQFREYLQPQRPILVAKGEYDPWGVPSQSKSEDGKDIDIEEIRNSLIGQSGLDASTTLEFDPNLVNSFWSVNIQNVGQQKAEEASFELPAVFGLQKSYGWYTISGNFGYTKFSNGKINIGSLMPSKSLDLSIWSSLSADEYIAKQTKLTHRDGTGKVKYAVKVYGFWRWTVIHLDIRNIMIVMGLLVFFIGVARYLMHDRRNKSNVETESSE